MKIENDIDEEDNIHYWVYDKKTDWFVLLFWIVTVSRSEIYQFFSCEEAALHVHGLSSVSPLLNSCPSISLSVTAINLYVGMEHGKQRYRKYYGGGASLHNRF